MLGSPAGPGGPNQRGLWPLTPIQSSASFTTEGFNNKCGVYSLFPGGPTFGSALYSHARTIGQFTSNYLQHSPSNNFYHKDSLFSSTGYTFGAPTPPPGSPYSPVPVTQFEFLSKGLNSNNSTQQSDYAVSPKKLQSQEKRCDEKCCNSIKQQCQNESGIKKLVEYGTTGCSRTNPVEWSGVNVKKEPELIPCQVPEVTTSALPVIKLEITSPKNTNEVQLSNANVGANGSGTAGMAAATAGGGLGGPTVLQCADDRNASLAAWSMGGAHNSTFATPALWQYSAPVPMEPMVPLPVPMPPVGFQLVRDPSTGGLLLLPTTGIEPLQQTVVWPNYHQSPSVLLPPLPPPPLQLLSSPSSDFLSSSTTLHQHTQTHSTRLLTVTTDNKRKIPLPGPTTTLIKIETDTTNLDQTKALQTVSTIGNNTGTVFTDPNMTPLVTTHVIYQHPPNLILSQAPSSENLCRSQATSPVTCLTPPPETTSIHEDILTVQDASNQTDTICNEDDTNLVPSDESSSVCSKPKEKDSKVTKMPRASTPPELEKVQVKQLEEFTNDIKFTESIVNEEPPIFKHCAPEIKPDISGLELLSNSIVEFEIGQTNILPEEIGASQVSHENSCHMKTNIAENPPQIKDNLGGLDLLCALAEQRILEENIERRCENNGILKERKKEKRKLKKHFNDQRYKQKKIKADKLKICSKLIKELKTNDRELLCSCPESYRTYKTPQSAEEVKKFIASRSQHSCCDNEWPVMNEMELDMRMKLADLQRQYREKQKELSKLKPKKHLHECKKRSRKRSTNSERSNTPPPQLDKIDMSVRSSEIPELLKPPMLYSFQTNRSLPLDSTSEVDEIKEEHFDHQLLEEGASSPEKNFSSKKRKVGRPKKLLSPACHVATETIVAKKPKNNFIGYFLAAKEKLQLQKKVCTNSPPRYVDEVNGTKNIKKNKTTTNKCCKIRPKLKAEPTIKSYLEDNLNRELYEEHCITIQELNHNNLEKMYNNNEEIVKDDKENGNLEKASPGENRCTLCSKHLEVDKLRVLTAMGGLFYAGHLNAVEPPDVYSITLDGERGNRPHIMSREEILRDAIVEIAPSSTEELTFGTRLCAYWSQQYRCLYPGSVAEPGTPDPALDSKFVAVEFDDGDSGRIALEDIRLLPPNYPIIEYDPNPLLSLSKRRRRASTSISTEERKTCTQPITQPPTIPQIGEVQKNHTESNELEKENRDMNKLEVESHKKRKHIKKKKRDKLKQRIEREEKKKKRKHKCIEEYCKHRKHHKKHRKHKKHHHHHHEVTEEKINVTTVVELPEINGIEEKEEDGEDTPICNPEDEVTMEDILESTNIKSKKLRDRQESCESRSKMSAFLPARQLWNWFGKGYKRPRAKGRSRKQFYKAIQREKETITVGDSAVFLSTGRPDRPYIGKIEAMWEICGTMIVKVKWFYHPEETVGCPSNLQYPGALFESPHVDENDVQTISHKCEVLPLVDYTNRLGNDPQRYATIYENNDIYYLAGHYDPTTTTLKMEPNIPFS